MVEALKPDSIVSYGSTPDNIFGEYKKQGIEIIPIENYLRTIRKAAI